MRRVFLLFTIALLSLPLPAQTRRRSTLPVDWTRILLPYVGSMAGSPSGIVTNYSIRNDGDHPVEIVTYADLGCVGGICLPPVQYQAWLQSGDTQTTHGEGFRAGEVLNVDARAAESIYVSARVHEFYPNVPSRPNEGATTGPQVPIAREIDFRKSIHLPSMPANVRTLLRVYSLQDAPIAAVKLFRVVPDEQDGTGLATETQIGGMTLELRPPRYYGPFVAEPAFEERDLTADLAALGMAVPGNRLAIQVDSPAPIWVMAVQVDPERHLLTFTSQSPARERAHPAVPAATARMLLPYLGAPVFDEGGLRTELVARNLSAHAVAFRFDPCSDAAGCRPDDLLPTTLAPGPSAIRARFTPAVVAKGGVFTVAAADADALALSVRVRGPSAPQTDVAVEGPEVAVARESDFRQFLHIIGAPNHLDTLLRVYSLSGAPTVTVGMYSVEFGRETLLETFMLDLSQPDIDSPGFAERDLTTELVDLDKQIPQSRIAFRIESPTPVWAMIVQRDPAQHVLAFIAQQ